MDHFKHFDDYNIMDICELNISKKTSIVILFSEILRSDALKWNYDEHSHSYYELHISLKGYCSLDIQKNNISFAENEYVLIYPHTSHKFNKISDDSLRFSLAFEIKNSNFEQQTNKYEFDQTTEYIKTLIEETVKEINTRDAGYNEIIKFHAQTILINILRNHTDIFKKENHTVVPSKSAMQKALDFIKTNLTSNIKSQDVANYSNYSLKQLNRIFKANFNMSVSDYIKAERIFIVKEYLETSSLTLNEIALLSGFSNEYHLCKVFKKSVGMTTSKYKSRFSRNQA